jgi:hypothetical protein
MTRRRFAPTEYQHPATYAAIVEEHQRAHTRRLAELKAASKLIVAIEPDLTALVAQRIYYGFDRYSMCLTDWVPATGYCNKKALAIGFSILGDAGDRAISALLARQWVVEDTKLDGRLSKVLLRKLKTRVRVVVDCNEAVAKALTPPPDTEAAR